MFYDGFVSFLDFLQQHLYSGSKYVTNHSAYSELLNFSFTRSGARTCKVFILAAYNAAVGGTVVQ